MSLIKCPECETEFDNALKSCPKCGCPVEVTHKNKTKVGNPKLNFLKNIEKMLAFRKNVLYNQTCCDMIALKRRLLYRIDTGFSWSECQ